jgi:hypothetical protein
MDKEYINIIFPVGSTIDEAIKELLSYKAKGKLACGEFNGIILYSDAVKKDEAYKNITDQTIFEFKRSKQEMLDDIKRKYENENK